MRPQMASAAGGAGGADGRDRSRSRDRLLFKAGQVRSVCNMFAALAEGVNLQAQKQKRESDRFLNSARPTGELREQVDEQIASLIQLAEHVKSMAQSLDSVADTL